MTPKEFKSQFKTIQILHFTLILSLVVISTTLYLLYNQQIPATNVGFAYVTSLIFIIGMGGSQFVFNRGLSTLQRKDDLHTKLSGYRSASILRYSLIEGSGLLSAVIYYLSGNYYLLLLIALAAAYLVMIRPTVPQFVQTCPLTSKQQAIVEEL